MSDDETVIHNPIEGLPEPKEENNGEPELETPVDSNKLLLEELSKLKEELAATRAQVANVDNSILEAKASNRNQQVMSIQQQINQARANKDFDAYERLNQQLGQVRQSMDNIAPAPNPALNKFMQEEGFHKPVASMDEQERFRFDHAILLEKRYRAEHRITGAASQEKEAEVYNFLRHKLRAMFPQHYSNTRNDTASMTHQNTIKRQVSTPIYNQESILRTLEPGEREYYELKLDKRDKDGAQAYLKKVFERRQTLKGQK